MPLVRPVKVDDAWKVVPFDEYSSVPAPIDAVTAMVPLPATPVQPAEVPEITGNVLTVAVTAVRVLPHVPLSNST